MTGSDGYFSGTCISDITITPSELVALGSVSPGIGLWQ